MSGGNERPKAAARRAVGTVDELRARCDVLRGALDCWIWRGSVARGRPGVRVTGVPGLSPTVICGQRATAAVVGLLAERKQGQSWTNVCCNPMCMAPHHLVLMTTRELFARLSAYGRLRRTKATCERISQAKLRTGQAAHPDLVAWALESRQGSMDVGRALGVSAGTVRCWRSRYINPTRVEAQGPNDMPLRHRPPDAQELPRAMRPPKKQHLEQPRIDERVKVTICPSRNYDPRYQVAPGAQPWGAGFAAAGIGRDVRTGAAWS